MKKLLFLLLISPLSYSEVIKFTCDGFVPYQVEYDTITEEGELKFLADIDVLVNKDILKPMKKKTSIHKLTINEDYYKFHISKHQFQARVFVYINRKNLMSRYEYTIFEWFGQCTKAEKELSSINII